MKKLTACSCALMLVLVLGMAAPPIVSAQEQGGTQTTNSGGGWGNIIGNIFRGGNNSNPAQTGNSSSNGSGSSPITGFVNWVIDTAIAFRNDNNLWSNESGNSIINAAQDVVGSFITGTVNALTGGVTGTPEGTNALGGEGPVDLTPGGSNSNTGSSDNDGGDTRPGSVGSGSSGGRPTGSVGSVNNPLSNGIDKNDAPSSNKEDTSNPFLFEYDPSMTNNNPSGAEAQSN